MKKLILQVNIELQEDLSYVGNRSFTRNKELYQLSEYQARKYAKRVNADYMLITDDSFMPGYHPIWQRLKFFELTEYDQILYLDMDVVILDCSPNIFELFKDEEFCATPDRNWDSKSKHIAEDMRKDQQRYNSSNTYRSFCSGVMLLSKEFIKKGSKIYKKYIDVYSRVRHDQGVMNAVIIELGEKYTELHKDWGMWNSSGRYFIHLGFWRKNNFDLQKFIKKYNITID